MLKVAREEIDAMGRVLLSGQLFRYHPGGECERFEGRFAKFLGVKHVAMCASGSTALAAALAGLGIGPGDEVIVPAHTYMATATSVLSVGAIPVIVDIDESIMMDPAALDDGVGRRTKAVIPVHMWGGVCDMDAILRIARKRKLLVVEDACQCVCGGYEGRPAGSMGHVGTFSFNYFKNMTCGEGGAVATNDRKVFDRARCMIDCCSFFWGGERGDVRPFAASGARVSELQGAMLNAQLDRVPALLKILRRYKKRVLRATASTGLVANPRHSPDYECATNIMYMLPTSDAAKRFAELGGGMICGNTGRHTYINWDPILNRRGAHHPALDPFKLPQNRHCRMTYRRDMFPRSLDILSRTVMLQPRPEWSEKQLRDFIAKITSAAAKVLPAKGS
jgi:dTDP-4-amino-4,6-dideoxygalactose transaminase